MVENPTLSYFMATRNKLPYLKRALEKLIAAKKPDEEILIADGNSTDGSKEYLAQLKAEGKIDYLISEKDFGVAHALNKLILKARGTLLKYLTDDDVFDYEAIEMCREFMLAHPTVDLLSGESGSYNRTNQAFEQEDPLQLVRALDYTEQYKEWQKSHTPFPFCDLSTVLRRASLRVVGLYYLSFPGPDVEYSLRNTAGRGNIAWYTGYVSVNISNPQSVSIVFMKKTKKLTEAIYTFYLKRKAPSFIAQKLKVVYFKVKSFFRSKPKASGKFETNWPTLAGIAEKWLTIKNNQKKSEFLFK